LQAKSAGGLWQVDEVVSARSSRIAVKLRAGMKCPGWGGVFSVQQKRKHSGSKTEALRKRGKLKSCVFLEEYDD
jgi:hypothetical protein